MLKNILIGACLVILISSCNNKRLHPEYTIISGQIKNAQSKEFLLFSMSGYQKKIALNEEGIFEDTLHSKDVICQIIMPEVNKDGVTLIKLKKGADISFTADAKNFRNTLHFTLDLADLNNFHNQKEKLFDSKDGFDKLWYREPKVSFEAKLQSLKEKYVMLLHSYKNIAKEDTKRSIEEIEDIIKRYQSRYAEAYKISQKLKKGTTSPSFENFENFDGSTTSLFDFKGKYVFIDVWATWCGPCKAQIPYLEELAEEYREKNIVFLSLSIDAQKDKDKWKAMIKGKNMNGIQLITPNVRDNDFIKGYEISGIPRFILLDPEGKIIDYDAPKPSNKEKIQALFTNNNI